MTVIKAIETYDYCKGNIVIMARSHFSKKVSKAKANQQF